MQAVADVQNMALQHHEFELQLRDGERLRLYVQAGMAEREMQRASLKKAELACRRLELEAKESVERAARAEVERDVACHEAAMAKLVTKGVVNTRAQIESELVVCLFLYRLKTPQIYIVKRVLHFSCTHVTWLNLLD